MQYSALGRTGTTVSRLGLGTLPFGASLDADASERLVHAALARGVNLFDTADVYHGGESERLLGRALGPRRDEAVIVSKVFDRVGEGPNEQGLSRRHVVRQVERSLARLGTDRIDVYLAHQPDLRTPLDETLRAFDDLVRAGKVIYVGCSNHTPLQLCEGLWRAERCGVTPYAVNQVPYHVFDRRLELELEGFCRRAGVGLMGYSPLACGALGGRYGGAVPGDSRCAVEDHWRSWHARIPERVFHDVRALTRIAADAGTSLPRLALAFLLRQGGVQQVIAGPRTEAQLDELVGAVELTLDAATLERIDQVTPPGGYTWFR